MYINVGVNLCEAENGNSKILGWLGSENISLNAFISIGLAAQFSVRSVWLQVTSSESTCQITSIEIRYE